MLFVVVLALAVERSVGLFTTPFSLGFFLLVTSLVFVALSWVYYHMSVDALPYTGRRPSWYRFSLDAVIAFAYTALIVSVDNPAQYGLVLFFVYALYGFHGLFTVYEYGWFRLSPLRTNSTPAFWFIFAPYFLIPYFAFPLLTPPFHDLLVILYPAGIVTSRYLRHVRGATISSTLNRIHLQPLPVVAVDVDGVLGDQVPHVLARAAQEKGIRMDKQAITEWDTKVGDEPFDKLISRYLLDPEFVKSMPVIPKAKEALDQIRKRASVVLASSRPTETEGATIDWFRERFGWTPRFINTAHSGKSCIPAQVLVDDNVDNAKQFALAKSNRRAILLRQPWNTRTESIADIVERKGIIIAANWDEVTKELLG